MNVAKISARHGRTAAPFHLPSLRRQIHQPALDAGGLLRANNPLHARSSRQRSRPLGTSSLHNVPAVRAISFARVLPNLAAKLIRIPAMVGAATISGLAYVQYQATRGFPMLQIWRVG